MLTKMVLRPYFTGPGNVHTVQDQETWCKSACDTCLALDCFAGRLSCHKSVYMYGCGR